MEFTNEQLDAIFPFHLLLDNHLAVSGFGRGLKKILPGLQTGKSLEDFFLIKAPTIPLDYDDVVKKTSQLFLFNVAGKDLDLKGQAVSFDGFILFILHPVILDSGGFKKFGISLKDFPINDSIVDTLILLNAQKIAINESKAFSGELIETNKNWRLQTKTWQIKSAARTKGTGKNKGNSKHTYRITIRTSAAYTIRKDGVSWPAYRGHCP